MLSRKELEPIRLSVADRVREGLSLEDVLYAYHAGARVAWRHLLDRAAPGQEGALAELAGAVIEYIDGVSAVVARAYLDEARHLQAEQDSLLHRLLDVIVIDGALTSELLAAAAQIGFDPTAPSYVPFSATRTGASPRTRTDHAARLREGGVLAVVDDAHVWGLAPCHGARKLDRDEWVTVIDEPSTRQQLRGSADMIRIAATLASAHGRLGAVHLNEVIPELVLARSPELAERLARQLIEPLEQYDAKRRGSALVHTIEVYLDSGLSRVSAARQLDLHPNSLDLRLRRVQELTGTNLGAVPDLVRLWLALKSRDMIDRTR